jgi:hypothetical protein
MSKASALEAANNQAVATLVSIACLRQEASAEEFQQRVNDLRKQLDRFNQLYFHSNGREELVAARRKLPGRPLAAALGETAVYFHDIIGRVAKKVLGDVGGLDITTELLPMCQDHVRSHIPELKDLEVLFEGLRGEYDDAKGMLEQADREETTQGDLDRPEAQADPKKGGIMPENSPRALMGIGYPAPLVPDPITLAQRVQAAVEEVQRNCVAKVRAMFDGMRRSLDARSAATAQELRDNRQSKAIVDLMAQWEEAEQQVVARVNSRETAEEIRAEAFRALASDTKPDAKPADFDFIGDWFAASNPAVKDFMRDIVRRKILSEDQGGMADLECFVTLQQAAAIVSRSKRTLEKHKAEMPVPRISDGGGKPDEWAWSELRPWLEKYSGRTLPSRFPADQFRKD